MATARYVALLVLAPLIAAPAACQLAVHTEPQRPASGAASAAPQGKRGPGVPAFWVRPGYRVDLVAENLADARFLEFDDRGTLYLSRPGSGDILALRQRGGRWAVANTFVSGRPTVHGLCFRDGWLWFTQTGSIHRGRDTNGDGKADEVVTVIADGKLPRGGGHWWRSILVTADSIYTSIGDSGNITDETATDRQKVWQFDKQGGNPRLLAAGVRNNEKLRLRPGTNEVWGVDHGSDWYGRPIGDRQGRQPITDFNPPDEFNRYAGGAFYGHPFVTDRRLPRVEYYSRPDIVELAERTVVPEWSFGAHWAANAFTFLTKPHFGADHVGDAFVACRGSWNRREMAGYRVERVLFDEVTGKPYGSLMIVGTLVGGQVLARPVDCAEAPDGSVFFSCDTTHRIYRISKDTGASGAAR